MSTIDQYYRSAKSSPAVPSVSCKSSSPSLLFPSPSSPPLPSFSSLGAKRVKVGNHQLITNKTLEELVDSTPLFVQNDWKRMRKELEEEGVILVRGVIPQEVINRGRTVLTNHLNSKKGALRTGSDPCCALIGVNDETKQLNEGYTIDAESGGQPGGREDDESIEKWKEIGNSKEIRDIYAGEHLFQFYQSLFQFDNQEEREEEERERKREKGKEKESENGGGGRCFTPFPGCTWLRMKGNKELTAEHTDYYYFKEATNIFSSFINNKKTDNTKRNTKKENENGKKENSKTSNCSVCGNEESTEQMMECTLCNDQFHCSCCSPPLPSSALSSFPGEYHCSSCSNSSFPYWTCWISLSSIPLLSGPLCLIPRSHRLHQEGYNNTIRSSRLPSSFTKAKAVRADWRSAFMQPGDLIVFNMKTIHAAAENKSQQYRISFDTRVTNLTKQIRNREKPQEEGEEGREAGVKEEGKPRKRKNENKKMESMGGRRCVRSKTSMMM